MQSFGCERATFLVRERCFLVEGRGELARRAEWIAIKGFGARTRAFAYVPARNRAR